MEFLNIVKENADEFKSIAENLFDNHAIQTHNGLYRLTEIEFYWNSVSHIDNSTYQRKHVQPKSGEWFFHYSGVDIALKNELTGGYGGILIRGIYDIDNKVFYKGPMVCTMRLFSGTNAFLQSIQTHIIPYTFEKSIIIESNRIGLGDNAKINNADKLDYRFQIDIKK